MKKIVFAVAIVLLAAPAWGLDIWCDVGDGNDANLVTVKYSGAGDVRAFALNIELGGNGTIGEVTCLSDAFGFQIYPGSISIDGSGNVSSWGSCKCDGSYPGTLDDSNSMTIEAGSLYEVAIDPDPCSDGNLVAFRVDGTDIVPVDIEVNPIRGGVINEDVSVASPIITDCEVELEPGTCLNSAAPEFTAWQGLGSPACWCYRKQCRGDIDGVQTGPFAVAIPDLTIFKTAYNKMVLPAGGECADLDHLQTGPFRVAIPDLTIFKAYYNNMVVPQCDAAPVITGPYNFWTDP